MELASKPLFFFKKDTHWTKSKKINSMSVYFSCSVLFCLHLAMQALVWLGMIGFGTVWLGPSYMNLRQLRILKTKFKERTSSCICVITVVCFSSALFCRYKLHVLVNNQLDAQSFSVYVYFNTLHVSSNHVLIIRRLSCINTTSGMCHCM